MFRLRDDEYRVDFENELDKDSISIVNEKIKQIRPWSGMAGSSQDYSIMRKNNIVFDELIDLGLVNFSYTVNGFPKNGRVYEFVKDKKIVYTELVC